MRVVPLYAREPGRNNVYVSEPQPAAGKVLYVDDEEALAGLAVRVLERAGYAAESYTAPGEALAAFSADPGAYALVMTDHNMPGMSGPGCPDRSQRCCQRGTGRRASRDRRLRRG